MKSEPCYMVNIVLDIPLVLENAKEKGLPLWNVDFDYLVHCQLKEIFGNIAPKPFTIANNSKRHLHILGYSKEDSLNLQQYAQTYSSPLTYSSCCWPKFVGKKMPDNWLNGTAYHFELRTTPVIRKSSGGPEIDVFLDQCFKQGQESTIDRQQVYHLWLRQLLQRQGGSDLLSTSIRALKRSRLLRRGKKIDGKRKAGTIERPDVRFTGVLKVKDPPLFNSLIANGIGRHKSFGFGMILLKPEKTRC